MRNPYTGEILYDNYGNEITKWQYKDKVTKSQLLQLSAEEILKVLIADRTKK